MKRRRYHPAQPVRSSLSRRNALRVVGRPRSSWASAPVRAEQALRGLENRILSASRSPRTGVSLSSDGRASATAHSTILLSPRHSGSVRWQRRTIPVGQKSESLRAHGDSDRCRRGSAPEHPAGGYQLPVFADCRILYKIFHNYVAFCDCESAAKAKLSGHRILLFEGKSEGSSPVSRPILSTD